MNEESVPPPGSEPASKPATTAGSDATAQPEADAPADAKPADQTTPPSDAPADYEPADQADTVPDTEAAPLPDTTADTPVDREPTSPPETEAGPLPGPGAGAATGTRPDSWADAQRDSAPDSQVNPLPGPHPTDHTETQARPQAAAQARPTPGPSAEAPTGTRPDSWADAYQDSPPDPGADAPPRPQAGSRPGFQPGDEAASGPQADAPLGAGARRLTRSQEGRLITGVCAGLARYTRIDAIVFRVGFALLVIATGIGVLLYIAAFLLMGAPDGGPSRIEKVSKRVFDGDTALALLGAVLGVSVVFNIVGNWGSGDALAVVVVFGLALLVARSRGADLVQVARGLPDRIKGQPLSSWTPNPPPPPASRMSDGMIDLARLGRRTDTYAAGPYATGPYATSPYATSPSATAPNVTDPTTPGPDPTPPYPPQTEPHGVDPYGRHPTDPYGTDPYAKGPYAADTAPPPYSRPTETPHVHRHRRSYLTALTLLAAALAAAVLYPVASDRPNLVWLQIVIAGALAVVAVGLLLGAWFGRDRKLVLVGAIMSFALASTSIAGNSAVARRTHHLMWRPAATAQAEQSHKVLVGQGVVDLTTVPLAPGQRLQVSAEVTLGVLAVKVPATARLEVDGHAYIGDITVDRQVTSGPGARVNRVLEPEAQTPGGTPTIVLHLRSKVGDMEVTRVPA